MPKFQGGDAGQGAARDVIIAGLDTVIGETVQVLVEAKRRGLASPKVDHLAQQLIALRTLRGQVRSGGADSAAFIATCTAAFDEAEAQIRQLRICGRRRGMNVDE